MVCCASAKRRSSRNQLSDALLSAMCWRSASQRSMLLLQGGGHDCSLVGRKSATGRRAVPVPGRLWPKRMIMWACPGSLGEALDLAAQVLELERLVEERRADAGPGRGQQDAFERGAGGDLVGGLVVVGGQYGEVRVGLEGRSARASGRSAGCARSRTAAG